MNINKIKKTIRFENNSYTHLFGYVKEYVLKIGSVKIQVKREKNRINNRNVLNINIYKSGVLLISI